MSGAPRNSARRRGRILASLDMTKRRSSYRSLFRAKRRISYHSQPRQTWPAAAVVFLIGTAIGLASCSIPASRPPPQEELPPPPQGREAEFQRALELTRRLAERDRGLDSMQTPAVMEYSTPEHHLKARELITVRKPQDLRIEAMSPFGVALVVAAKDTRLAIFRSSDNTLMRGAATAETLERFAQVPLAPKPAVDLLMGLAPNPQLLSRVPDSVRVEDDNLLLAGYSMPDGSGVELGFRDGQLAVVRHRLSDGRISYEVRYADYRDIGGLMMAYELDADFPLAGSHAKFRYQRPIVNGPIADSMFELSPGASTREISLDDQRLSSASAPAR
jgi:hypothetical protein